MTTPEPTQTEPAARRARPFRPQPTTVTPDFTTAENFETWMNSDPEPPTPRTPADDTYAIDVAAWFIDELTHANPAQRAITFISAADALAPVPDASLAVTITPTAPLHDLLNRHSSGSDPIEFAFRDLIAHAHRLGLAITVTMTAPLELLPPHVTAVHHATMYPTTDRPPTRT